MTQFNIGSQHAGTINNIGGDASIGHNEGHYSAGAARIAIDELRAAITVLEPADRDVVSRMVDDLDADLQRGTTQPAVSRLRRLTSWLADSGALAAAGMALAEPLARIARLLGPAAESVLRHLPV